MKHPTLQTKLIVRLLLVLLGIGLLFSISLNYYLRFLLETEVADKANLVFSNVLAMQTYVRETLRPAMFEVLPQDAFIIEAMSTSYVTRKLMSDLNMSSNQFTYRRVALDPRNPEYGANALERELIAYFQANPKVSSLSKYLKINGEECLVMAQPAVFDQTCMHCHGRPEDAPGVLRARYGDVRGFGRFEGEVGGLDSLIMPVEREAAAIHKISLGFILVFICGTVVILALSHFTFDRIMVSNIGRLSALMRSRFPEEADQALGKGPGANGDEIEGMLANMERLADHLRQAKEQLSQHAATLETKVRERTAAVRQEAEARQADVRLFLRVLELFVTGADRSSLLMRVLETVLNRFGADSAFFHCFFSLNAHVYPPEAKPGELTKEQRDLLLDGQGIFTGQKAVVPVQSTDIIRGALHIRWSARTTLPPQEEDVLMAVGRQLGIALENLEAMENLMRQKAVLESIFEGIADPLLLLDGSGGVLHANESGHQLVAALTNGDQNPCELQALKPMTTGTSGHGPAIQREILLPNGRSLMLRAYPLCGYGGLNRTIVFARDNTREKTMLAKLQQSEKSMAMGILAAGMAHEINNPLGVILCYARILWDNGQSPQAEDLGIIIHHTLQAQRVLSDLMRFASPRPEAVSLVNLSEVAGFIARVFQIKAVKAGVVMETDVPVGLPLVRGNTPALEQILTNLLLNSMDALAEHPGNNPGRIRISAQHDTLSGEVLLRVSDNGPGIPEEHLTRIFDPFFTTKDVGKGTGLGLCVVYGLVRDLGGRIDVDASEGATFTIRLQTDQDNEHA